MERERMATESSKQLKDRCKWLEEKFRVLEGASNHHIDAKDLNSLVGVAARWYNQLSSARIGSWRDLAQVFMQQYNHVTDMTLDRITLQNMEKKPNECFRQYTQRWREVAMQAPFITHMIRSTVKSFADIVMAGEMIENAIKDGKIEGEMAKRSTPRRKDNEVNNMNSFNSRAITVGQPKAAAVNQQSTQRQESGTRQNSKRMQFMPIPVTYRELYQSLYDAHAIAPFHLKPLQPPYPKWYDANAKCEYHTGIPGHLIENCIGFKKAVERLIKIRIVKFYNTPNAENPLLDHGNQGVNAIDETREGRIKEDVAKVKTPMKVIWEEMVKRGMLTSRKGRERMGNYCEFHGEGSSCKRQICVLENERQGTSRPRMIISFPWNNEVGAQTGPKVVIHKPTPFPYKDDKRVPWSYDCSVIVLERESIASASRGVQNEGSHTRSGKRYDEGAIRVEPTKTKDVDVEKKKEVKVPVKKLVNEEEAKEFLKFLKHSEYSVVEQLHRQPACISVLALLLSSKVHRDALLKSHKDGPENDDGEGSITRKRTRKTVARRGSNPKTV
ncbi:uncharacterized protein [Gossypium hirsutum]|uniref:Retrotransposon gag domain-containing protein n=1 Tax=Gossypium hirsutum TaxID=3635 RepID=A0ABM3BW85_GOSHI|nr:uncharacterized protein LOC121230489 [Gossypium hirsutum]